MNKADHPSKPAYRSRARLSPMVLSASRYGKHQDTPDSHPSTSTEHGARALALLPTQYKNCHPSSRQCTVAVYVHSGLTGHDGAITPRTPQNKLHYRFRCSGPSATSAQMRKCVILISTLFLANAGHSKTLRGRSNPDSPGAIHAVAVLDAQSPRARAGFVH